LISKVVVREDPWPSASNIDVCGVGISAEDGDQDAFHGLFDVFLHLSLDRMDEAGGTASEMIFDRGRSI